jgi:uncharacterized OB-fold protein
MIKAIIVAMIAWYLLMMWMKHKLTEETVPHHAEEIKLYECMECGHPQVYNNEYCSECGSEQLAIIDDNYYMNVN